MYDDLDALIRQHSPFVWRVLLHLGVPRAHLDDVCQEVLLVVCRKLPEFQGRSSVRTWVYAICKTQTKAFFRKLGERRESLILDAEQGTEHGAPGTQDRSVWVKQAHDELLAALETLSDEQRSVFILYEIEEESMEEIAQLLGAPVSTCYSRLQIARNKVQASVRRRDQARLRLVSGGSR